MRRIAGLLVVALALGLSTPAVAAPEPTTVYVVRHAEKQRSPERQADPALTERGMARAAELRDLLADADVAAVYSTPYRRTLMTAGPTAGAAGLTTIHYRPGKAPGAGGLPSREALLTAHAGAAVLVVGHSNTVPRIVAALRGGGDEAGDAAEEIAEDEYDNLYEVELRGDETRVRRHRYGPLPPTRRIVVSGHVPGQGAVSGVTLVRGRIVVCFDEGTQVQEWSPDTGGFVGEAPRDLPVGWLTKELDLEGLASGPDAVFAVGSHSLVRRAARGDKQYERNRERLATVTRGGRNQRDRLFRIPVEQGRLRHLDASALDLRALLENDRWLQRAAAVPGKENGVDVEGLAVDGDWLVLGLRGPVLRGNFTPILRVRPDADFAKVKEHEVVFVDLGGRGVRGLTRCATGFLVLAGPSAGEPVGFRLFHWDGEDMLPGEREDGDPSQRVGRLTLLGTLPHGADRKPEGVAVVSESDSAYTVLVVHDGAPDGAPTEYRVRKVPGL